MIMKFKKKCLDRHVESVDDSLKIKKLGWNSSLCRNIVSHYYYSQNLINFR